ncbi:hypothetical protein OKW49_002914 [Paraburkholderia youngii]|uniref:hypothetical protein n=1 Tax=Paraburkholderia youngii TaxID=2782701 RepID=UPI003D2237AB
MSTLGTLTEWAQHMGPLTVALVIAVRTVIAWLVSRRAARDRKKLGLEITRLRGDADRVERENAHLEYKIEKLMAEFERQQSTDTMAGQHSDVEDHDRPLPIAGIAVSPSRSD